MKWPFSLLLASLLAATVSQAADFVWLEGEKPTSKNYPCGPAGVERSQLLSGNAWLLADLDAGKVQRECPKDGIRLGYDFVVAVGRKLRGLEPHRHGIEPVGLRVADR